MDLGDEVQIVKGKYGTEANPAVATFLGYRGRISCRVRLHSGNKEVTIRLKSLKQQATATEPGLPSSSKAKANPSQNNPPPNSHRQEEKQTDQHKKDILILHLAHLGKLALLLSEQVQAVSVQLNRLDLKE